MRRRSRWITAAVFAAWMLLSASAVGVSAQQAGTPPQAAPAHAAPPQQADAAEATPLNVDSDPVPSPDPDTKTAAPAKEPAKTGEITKENGRYTLRTNAYEVRLNASVIDASGQVVENLTQDAFHVYEDGVPQTIIGFRHEDVPVSLGILIDSSGSMYDKRAAVDAASLDLVRLSNRQDEAFLVDFSSEAYIDQDFTSSIEKLQQGLAYIKSSGGTALYDAVIASADYLAKNAKRQQAGSADCDRRRRQRLQRNAGADDSSRAGSGWAGDLLHRAAVWRRCQPQRGAALTRGADGTGGADRRAGLLSALAKEVDGIAREVAQDIRQQYTIEYRSTKSPELGGYRQIHVEAKEKGYRGLQVRTRPGYFPKVAGAGGARSETSGK